MTFEQTAVAEQAQSEFMDWLTSRGYAPSPAPFIAEEVPTEFPVVTAPGGLPRGWAWVDSFGHDFHVCRTPNAWAVTSDWAITSRMALTYGSRVLRLVAIRPTLGGLIEAVFASSPVNHSTRMQLTGLLGRCASPEDDWKAETMLAAFGAMPSIPEAAYCPDLTLP